MSSDQQPGKKPAGAPIVTRRVRTQDQQTASGAISAVAYVTDQVQPGTIFTMFRYLGRPPTRS